MTEQNTDDIQLAVAEGGAYEVIRKRLEQQGKQLERKVQQLNSTRLEAFGETELKVLGRVRVRTENNCVPRDMVRVGTKLILFGYNVFIGLKKSTQVADVFSLYKLIETDAGFEVEPYQANDHFLLDNNFKQDFIELYEYYKTTRLLSLHIVNEKLLMVFQIGRNIADIRVFRWQVQQDQVSYLDNRGERDLVEPARHDFEWQQTERGQHVNGKFPHINILDKVFVETVNGDLTIKVEDNTDDGLGIYREAVEDANQSLADADVHYAELGSLILLKIKPYREQDFRYLIFNTRNQQVDRIDAVGLSCVQLPNDHGLIFPGGYYLQNGEYKLFDNTPPNLSFSRVIRSPNGEDALYLFYEQEAGVSALFSYNLIEKKLQNPIYVHGASFFRDGQMLVFKAESAEPTRIHPMQVWETPYYHEEFMAQQPATQSVLGNIGNAELVRGISDCYSLVRAIVSQQVSLAHYEDLIAASQRLFDHYHWLDEDMVGVLDTDIREISNTAELVLDEFEKVSSIRQQTSKTLADAQTRQQTILKNLFIDSWKTPQEFVDALAALHQQQGHLTTINELRYIDQGEVKQMQDQVVEKIEVIGLATVKFLSAKQALLPYHERIEECLSKLDKTQATVEIEPLTQALAKMSLSLDVLNETLAGLKVKDTQVRIAILEAISELYGKLNQAKAKIKHKAKSFRSEEAVAEFSAQFKLFSQTINSALESVASPEQCDDQLSRLLTQLEELESRFADFDEFLGDIVQQREGLLEAFQTRKQALLDERQRRCQNIITAIDRILTSVQRRCQSFSNVDELNTYLASDNMVLKLQQLIVQLQELQASVAADDAQARLNALQEQAIRSLRDQQDIFEDGGAIIKLGKHRFTVNTQMLDLTLINRQQQLVWHIIGTDFYQAADDPQLMALTDVWEQALLSETATVYRAEYLAYSLLHSAEHGQDDLDFDLLNKTLKTPGALLDVVRHYASSRYQEGYAKGIHDVDASTLLEKLLPLRQVVGLLRFTPQQRALAIAFWCFGALLDSQKNNLQQQAQSAAELQKSLSSNRAQQSIAGELDSAMASFQDEVLAQDSVNTKAASIYLVLELAQKPIAFIRSQQAASLIELFHQHLEKIAHRADYQVAIEQCHGQTKALWQLTDAWLQGLVKQRQKPELARFIPEAIVAILAPSIAAKHSQVKLEVAFDNLMGDHLRIKEQKLSLNIDEFSERLSHHQEFTCPRFQQYQSLRQTLIKQQRQQLQLASYQAKPLTSFVRNQLINDVYLPIIGDNLAKQMGTEGKNKRTDLMGLLLLISPPGYGKTTLMEYVANRLGLIFMKINCPALGHSVQSLDPEQAPNATAAKELEKLNLGLEMGNNVMLYLDDIQHTHAEFLQKFISLCDGSRRIEGIWQGQTKTYDLRGKKFCVIMAGNPYTESGDVFKIPDMLANRADIYNLGDVLSGNDDIFAQSYIENSLTANAVLQPLAVRSMDDVYRFMKMAAGDKVADNEFEHPYAGSEVNEVVAIMQNMLKIRDVILMVNQQYIYSAAQDDRYRTEPTFKLQGSYRDMNKMAEKVTAILNDQELQAIISDHYAGEAQTLTQGAEENLLKLNDLRGTLSNEENERWQTIKQEYSRLNKLGDDDNPAVQMVNQLSYIAEHLTAISGQLQAPSPLLELTQQVAGLQAQIAKTEMNVEVINQPVPGLELAMQKMAELFEVSFLPVFSAMEHKIKMEQDTWERVKALSEDFKKLKIKK